MFIQRIKWNCLFEEKKTMKDNALRLVYSHDKVANVIRRVQWGEPGWMNDGDLQLMRYSFVQDRIVCHGIVLFSSADNGVVCDFIADTPEAITRLRREFINLLEDTNATNNTQVSSRSASEAVVGHS
jgi:phenolic acid decarboxylase